VLRFRNEEVEGDIDLVCRIIHEACMKAARSIEG
jgi:very-short-patch-repair endonuclease